MDKDKAVGCMNVLDNTFGYVTQMMLDSNARPLSPEKVKPDPAHAAKERQAVCPATELLVYFHSFEAIEPSKIETIKYCSSPIMFALYSSPMGWVPTLHQPVETVTRLWLHWLFRSPHSRELVQPKTMRTISVCVYDIRRLVIVPHPSRRLYDKYPK